MYDDEERVTEITPPLPLSHLQLLNVILEREMEVESEVNSNIVPFPLNRVIFSNVTLSHDILPLPISNSGVLLVPYFEVPPLIGQPGHRCESQVCERTSV